MKPLADTCSTLLGSALVLWLVTVGAQAQALPPAPVTDAWDAFPLGTRLVEPGGRVTTDLPVTQTFTGEPLTVPVFAIRGQAPGVTLCLVAGIHGDEVNGVEVVRRVFADTRPEDVHGTLVGVPIANPQGFSRKSRYLPDRRDLNRFFPGSASGSAASRIAHVIFQNVVRRCDAVIDLHTASFHRTNLLHLRADMHQPATAQLARAFRAPVIVQHAGGAGTLRRAATDRGIAAVTVEAGEPGYFDVRDIVMVVAGIRRVLGQMQIVGAAAVVERTAAVEFRASRWVRSNNGGILLSAVGLGDTVARGQLLGHVIDPIADQRTAIVAPAYGMLIGMARNQVVLPGFAAYHVALRAALPAAAHTPAADDPQLSPDDDD